MCTIAIEALTPFNRTLRIKMYKNIARSGLFCRIAKRSIAWIRIYINEPNEPRTRNAGVSKTTLLEQPAAAISSISKMCANRKKLDLVRSIYPFQALDIKLKYFQVVHVSLFPSNKRLRLLQVHCLVTYNSSDLNVTVVEVA